MTQDEKLIWASVFARVHEHYIEQHTQGGQLAARSDAIAYGIAEADRTIMAFRRRLEHGEPMHYEKELEEERRPLVQGTGLEL